MKAPGAPITTISALVTVLKTRPSVWDAGLNRAQPCAFVINQILSTILLKLKYGLFYHVKEKK